MVGRGGVGLGAKMDGRKVCKGLCKEMVQILMIGRWGLKKTEGKVAGKVYRKKGRICGLK